MGVQIVNKEFRAQKRVLWSQKAHIAHLKMSRPSLREQSKQVEGECGVLNFCHNIIAAQRIDAFNWGKTLSFGIFARRG